MVTRHRQQIKFTINALFGGRETRVKSVKQKIFGAAFIVGCFTIISQIGGFAKELTMAAWFGTGDAVDAFLIALLVPSFIINVLAGAISASYLPTFIRVYRNRGQAEAQKLLTISLISISLS